MSEEMVAEPDDLRRIAQQHREFAVRLRKWGEVPRALLDNFLIESGTLCAPMHAALTEFYDNRHDKVECQADMHDQAGDQLLTTADALERSDLEGQQRILAATGQPDFTTSVPDADRPGGPIGRR